jgi:hypothetical protein
MGPAANVFIDKGFVVGALLFVYDVELLDVGDPLLEGFVADGVLHLAGLFLGSLFRDAQDPINLLGSWSPGVNFLGQQDIKCFQPCS